MRAIFPSSLAQTETMRLTLQRKQSALAKAEIEIGTGRHADVAIALGGRMSAVVDMRALSTELEAIEHSNGQVKGRFDTAQSALSAIGDVAQDLFASIVAARQSGADRSVLIDDARSRMEQLQALSRSTSDGVFVLSGINAGAPPLDDYLANPPGSAKTAVATAFSGLVAGAGGQTSMISAADMQTYLDTTFSALFDDPSWGSAFSSAATEGMTHRISINETIEAPVTANDPAIRDLYEVLAGLLDSDIENLNAEAFDVLADRLAKTAASASSAIAGAQSSLGIAQERLAKATDRIVLERATLERRVGAEESVDSYEVATRITSLMTALETSYSMTARLMNMTLLKYL